jgi:hypothetical protein
MPYTLITKQGNIMQFYVKSTAELYQTLKGGTLVTNDILVDNPVQTVYN